MCSQCHSPTAPREAHASVSFWKAEGEAANEAYQDCFFFERAPLLKKARVMSFQLIFFSSPQQKHRNQNVVSAPTIVRAGQALVVGEEHPKEVRFLVLATLGWTVCRIDNLLTA